MKRGGSPGLDLRIEPVDLQRAAEPEAKKARYRIPWSVSRAPRSFCESSVMDFDMQTLTAAGFTGFRSFAELELDEIPQAPGIYAVLMPEGFTPRFLAGSAGGHFKGKDPSLPQAALAAEWVAGAEVLYIGKAGAGKTGKRGLRKRIREMSDFGRGVPAGHWGGRLLWQLADSQALMVAWKELPPELVNEAEAGCQEDFRAFHGRLPFANLAQARNTAH